MSIVTVQLGQCGNQIGHEVFSALCSDIRGTHGLCSKKENESYHDSCKERFFCEEESGGTALNSFFFPLRVWFQHTETSSSFFLGRSMVSGAQIWF